MQHSITCPHCGESFTIDEEGYADIAQQVRNEEFDRELRSRVELVEQDKRRAVELAETKAAGELQRAAADKDAQIERLKAQLDSAGTAQDLAVQQAVADAQSQLAELRNTLERERLEREHDERLAKAQLETELQRSAARKDLEIERLKARIEAADMKHEMQVAQAVGEVERERDELRGSLEKAKLEKDIERRSLEERYETQLRDRDAEIERIREFKARLSTKMVGESLERHCQNEFNSMRMGLFPNAYFEKDNDARTGSKGDFIFRDYDRPEGGEGRVEIISIMFEMKNENETTATKHKNEDFLKELDKDRREKGCEYAVLVSMLEADSDLYNQGIVDVSYRYPKMYVIRPQFFIQMITLLRNAALNSLDYRRELEDMRERNIDITHFEERLERFKSAFEYQWGKASKNFEKVIDEIDKSIDHLQKVRTALLGSERSLEQANKRAQEITVRKLTYRNPTMAAKFKEARAARDEERERLETGEEAEARILEAGETEPAETVEATVEAEGARTADEAQE